MRPKHVAIVGCDPDIDAIEIRTPQNLHEPMVIAAAQAKKHIALQKPMTIEFRMPRRDDRGDEGAGLPLSTDG